MIDKARLRTDYMKCRQNVTDPQAQRLTGTDARGYYGISILIPQGNENFYIFIHETKTRKKRYKYAII